MKPPRDPTVGGHGLDHDVTVAQIATRIAPDPRTAEKAWCAAMLHSVDRMFERGNTKLIEEQTRVLLKFLLDGHFTIEEIEEICQAALRHAELNRDDQSITQQVLMDADRLANLMLSVVIRAGQLMPGIPSLEFEYLNERNPATTYHDPKSVLDDLRNNLAEYPCKLRTPAAVALSAKYTKQLEAYIASIVESYGELGLTGMSL